MKYRNVKDNNISILGYGLAKLPSDEKEAIDLIEYALNEGINFFDTGYTYLNGKSEETLGKVINKIDRKSIYISSKAPVWLYKNEDDFDKILNDQLNRLNTTYIDYYFLHGLNYYSWELTKKFNVLDKLIQAKKEGKIKNIGFSFQDNINVFQDIISSFDFDICMISINMLEPDFQMGMEGIKLLNEKNIPIICMQPFLGGSILDIMNKKYIDLNFKYIWNLKNVISIIPSMTKKEHLIDNISYANNNISLDEDDFNLINDLRKNYQDKKYIKCNECFKCVNNCNVPIPYLFKLYNYYKITHDFEKFKEKYLYTIARHGGFNYSCNKCNKCLNNCPNNIDIPSFLEEINEVTRKI
jgi:hypothetical protein